VTGEESAVNKIRIQGIEHGTVMASPGANRIPEAAEYVKARGARFQHYGWPGVTRTPDGDILVSASERIAHVDPFGRVVVSRSTDDGRTWTEPQVIFDSDTDDRDATLNTLPDGTVVATWFSSKSWLRSDYFQPEWETMKARLKPDGASALARGWLRRSHDGGRTWEEAVYPTIVGQHAGPTVLSNGDMIYCGPAPGPDGQRYVATRSADGGLTWAVVGKIPCSSYAAGDDGRKFTDFNESHALEVEPGRILCVLRSGTANRNVHLTRSEDGGAVWSEPEDLGVYGFPSYLVPLAAGPIMCLFGDRRGPRAIRGMFSYDAGRTWDVDNVFTVWERPTVTDMGYPSGIEVSPGQVLCVFYSVPVPDMTPDYQSFNPNEAGILSATIQLDLP